MDMTVEATMTVENNLLLPLEKRNAEKIIIVDDYALI
tara:strand:- start:754 stop:864 length:111 start_codon:yes stop_codon:yes gene_type:complete